MRRGASHRRRRLTRGAFAAARRRCVAGGSCRPSISRSSSSKLDSSSSRVISAMSRAVRLIAGPRRSTSRARADRPPRAPRARLLSPTTRSPAGFAAAAARHARRWPIRCPARSRSAAPPVAPICRNCSSSPSLTQGARRRSSASDTASTPPAAARRCSMCLSEISRTLISPVILPTTQRSGVTSPPTTAEPRPQAPSMVITERSPVVGLRVNITPAVRASTIDCTTTAIATHCFGDAAVTAVADRFHRIQAATSSRAHDPACACASLDPQIRVLQPGEAGVAGILGGGGRAHRHIGLPGARAQRSVCAAQLVGHLFGQRHRRARARAARPRRRVIASRSPARSASTRARTGACALERLAGTPRTPRCGPRSPAARRCRRGSARPGCRPCRRPRRVRAA